MSDFKVVYDSPNKSDYLFIKKYLKGGKVQINLYDGTNILLENKEKDKYSVGVSLSIDLKTKKIAKHLKLEKGASVYFIGGKHVGKQGVIEDILKKEIGKDMIKVRIGKESVQTLKNYAFIIEDKSI